MRIILIVENHADRLLLTFTVSITHIVNILRILEKDHHYVSASTKMFLYINVKQKSKIPS